MSGIWVILGSVYFAGGLLAVDDLFEVISNICYLKSSFLTINTAHLFQDYENDNGYGDYGDYDIDQDMIKAGEVQFYVAIFSSL